MAHAPHGLRPGTRLTRRTVVRQGAVLGLGIPLLSTILAACGGSDDKSTATQGAAGGATGTSGGVTINQNATATPGSSGASAGSPSAAATSAVAGTPGGSVTFTRSEDSTSLDPVLWHNPDIWPFMNVYDQLIKVNDKGVELIPGLAEKWDVSTDGLTYTFHLRNGVKFSDGSDMTVDDVTWSLERARTNKDGGWNFTLMQVKTITATDPTTVTIALTGVWSPFLSDISMFNASIISKAFATKVGEAQLATQAMGTGAFSVKEWKKAEYVLLAKNTNYWETGLPYVDEIKINVVPDTNSQLVQLQGKQTDGVIGQGDVPFNRVPDLQKDANVQVQKFLSTYVNFAILNVRETPLDDVKIRQALNYATDKQALIDTILFGNAEVSNSFMPNGALYWNPDQQPYAYDLAKANELIASSKSPTGFKLAFTVASGNSLQTQIATALKDMWAKINVNLDIQQLDPSTVRANVLANDYQAALSGWTNDIIDPDELVSYAILPESNDNFHTGWSNQNAIDLAKQAQTETDPEKRRQLYYQVQQIHKDDGPCVYLYVVPYIDALSKRVQGFFHHPMGQYVFARMFVQG
jgi:peptide/nickel transport system substrate-binding protein